MFLSPALALALTLFNKNISFSEDLKKWCKRALKPFRDTQKAGQGSLWRWAAQGIASSPPCPMACVLACDPWKPHMKTGPKGLQTSAHTRMCAGTYPRTGKGTQPASGSQGCGRVGQGRHMGTPLEDTAPRSPDGHCPSPRENPGHPL